MPLNIDVFSLIFQCFSDHFPLPAAIFFCIVFEPVSSLAASAGVFFFVRAPKGAHAESTGRANTLSMFFKGRSRTGASTMKTKIAENVEILT